MLSTRNFYETIAANETLDAELRDFATAALAKLDKSNATRASKAAEKKAAENAPIIEAVRTYLTKNPGAHTAAEIGAAVEQSTQKILHIVDKIDGIVKGETIVNKRVVGTYSL